MASSENSNQRVTNATLALKIDNLSKQFDSWKIETREYRKDRDERLRAAEQLLARHDSEIENVKRGINIKATISGAIASAVAVLARLGINS